MGSAKDSEQPVPDLLKQDTCVPICQGKVCGPNGCGGVCGTCPANHACCSGSCVAPPAKCSCTCHCKDQNNPNCVTNQATSSLANADCDEVCTTACTMGCGGLVSSSGDCPPTATCP